MKNILFIFAFLSICKSLNAQVNVSQQTHIVQCKNTPTEFSFKGNENETDHLTFMGVPINGDRKKFALQIRSKGFEYTEETPDLITLKGSFAGYRDCKIFVFSTKKDIAYGVGINLPNNYTWKDLSSNYYKIKDWLILKYGTPTNSTETFNTNSDVTSDTDKLRCVKNEECEYTTTFNTKQGRINVSISHIQVELDDFCYVSMYYVDNTNYNIKKAESIEDL